MASHQAVIGPADPGLVWHCAYDDLCFVVCYAGFVHGGEWETNENGKVPTGVRRQELVFIGPGLKTLELEAALDECLLTDAEVEQIDDLQTTGEAKAKEPESEVDHENYALGHAHGHGDSGGSREQICEAQGWWCALKDAFPAYEVECCEADPGCEDHRAPSGVPKLRFKPGDRVLCNCGEWEAGIITGLWYREDEWPRGQYAPYQVKLDSGDMICAPNDVDECIRIAGGKPTGSLPQLRFKAGDRVLCNCGEAWEKGTITSLHYHEDTWPHGEFAPYQVTLDDGRFVCAPSDNDACITQDPSERSPKRVKDATKVGAKTD